jgi:hypothetical protein
LRPLTATLRVLPALLTSTLRLEAAGSEPASSASVKVSRIWRALRSSAATAEALLLRVGAALSWL